MWLVSWAVARQHLSKADTPYCWKHSPNLLCYRDRVSTVRHDPQHITVSQETETRELTTPPIQLTFDLTVYSFLKRSIIAQTIAPTTNGLICLQSI